MQIEQSKWIESKDWEPALGNKLGEAVQLVLLFGNTSILKSGE